MTTISFITIQRIYAKYPEIHAYLKKHGYNNHQHAFFTGTEICENITVKRLFMLSHKGMIYEIAPKDGELQNEIVNNHEIIAAIIRVLHTETNGRHPYLRDTLREYSMASNKLSVAPNGSLF